MGALEIHSLIQRKSPTREAMHLLKKETKDLSLDASQALLRSGALWLSVGVAIISMSENPSRFFFVGKLLT